MTAAVIGLSVAVVLLSVLVAGLLRSHAEILTALHELGAGLDLDRDRGPVPITIDGVRRPRADPGATVPDSIAGQALDGDAVVVSLSAARPTLLAFLSSGCTTCQAFWTAFSEPRLVVPGDARLVVVTRAFDEESPAALAAHDAPVTQVASSAAWDDFAVPGSPYFVLVSGAGGAGARVVGEGSAATWPAVATLMGQALEDARHTAAAGRP